MMGPRRWRLTYLERVPHSPNPSPNPKQVLNQELIRRIKAVKALDARVRHTRLKPQTIRPQAGRYSHGLALDRSPRRPRTPRQWSLASHRSAVRSSPRASAWACGWSRG